MIYETLKTYIDSGDNDLIIKLNANSYYNGNSIRYYSTEEIAVLVERDLDYLGIGHRRLTKFNDYIYPNEYRLALQTAYHRNTILYDERGYHFILQHADDSWSSKIGSEPSIILVNKYDNLLDVTWDLRKIFNDYPMTFEWIDYYNNNTIYFAIAP